jgi:hypothetical protein
MLQTQFALPDDAVDHLIVRVSRSVPITLFNENPIVPYEGDPFEVSCAKVPSHNYYFMNGNERLVILPITNPKQTCRFAASKLSHIPAMCAFELDGQNIPLDTPIFTLKAHPLRPISVLKRHVVFSVVTEMNDGQQRESLGITPLMTGKQAQQELKVKKGTSFLTPLLVYKSRLMGSDEYGQDPIVKHNPFLDDVFVRWVAPTFRDPRWQAILFFFNSNHSGFSPRNQRRRSARRRRSLRKNLL